VRKVLHVVENLDRKATEAWLIRMLRHARKKGIELDWTFYCTLGKPGDMDDEARELGARVVHSPSPLGEKRAFMSGLRSEVVRGNYDVMHSHHDLVSAVYLVATQGTSLQRRIVHIHNSADALPSRAGLKQDVLKGMMREICLITADRIVGNSNNSLNTFLNGRARRNGRDVVHYCGVDAAPFAGSAPDRAAFRRSLNLPGNSRILLFAGRMVPEKDPLFAVDVLAQMRRNNSSVAGVFVGAGPLSDAVSDRIARLGLADCFRDMGWRPDVAGIMSCSDCFIQPGPEEPMEGLGLAVVEAQLAGLPLLFSLGIPDDALLPSASFRRVPRAAGANAWAEAALSLIDSPEPSRETALRELKSSPFDMDFALNDLLRLHGH
jgi:glycosyltransferase involved in cell wall biosynthesis